MQKNSIRRSIAFLIVHACITFPPTVMAVLPFTVKSNQHPRVYIDSARVTEIRAASQAMIPLNAAVFPSQQAGTLSFDIYALPRTNTSQYENLGIFDAHDSTRDHIFIRHLDEEVKDINGNPTGLTSCNTSVGTPGTPPAILCFQAALQSAQLPRSYIASLLFTLPANEWHTLSISWNTTTHKASFKIDGTVFLMPWTTSGVSWTPAGQRFVFTGRDGLDNITLYGSDDLTTNPPPLVNYSMNDASGFTVTDSSGKGYTARISTGVTWETRSAGNTNIHMDGKTGKLSVMAGSVLSEAWADFYGLASWYAGQLNNGSSPVMVGTGSVDYIKGVARSIGLAYLVSGEAKFKDAALAYAMRLVAVNPRNTGNDTTQAGRIEAMGIIYDWLYNHMDTINTNTGNTYGVDLVTAIKETIKFREESVCGTGTLDISTWTCSTSPPDPSTWSCSNPPANPYAVGGHSHLNNTGISAALFAIIDEHHELDNILNTEYQNFICLYNPLRAWVGIDGGYHMGWFYSGVYTFLDSIQLWNVASNVSMLSSWQGKLIDRYIYGLRGDMSFPMSGDGALGFPIYRYSGFTPSHEMLTAFALWGSKYYGNTSAQRFYNRWILPAKAGDRFSELLYWTPNLPDSPIEQLAFSRLFRNAGQVLMRDTWDYPNATLLEFKSTSFWNENHHHLDQNAFTIFYKAPLLIDSGFYDDYATSHWYNYFTRTIAHNTLTVWDPVETFIRGGINYSNDGGQRFIEPNYPVLAQIQACPPGVTSTMQKPCGTHHFDGITAYEYGDLYTFVVGNASKAYAGPAGSLYQKLDQQNGFIRNLIFLRRPSFWSHPITIVFDKVTAVPGKESLVKRFLLHTANEPEPAGEKIRDGQYRMNGNTITVRNGSGLLFAQTLLPENPVLTKVGGKDTTGDYRFLVPNMGGTLLNYPPDPDPGPINPDMGGWRIEITAPTPTGREYFLHVMSVADNNGVSAPPTAQNLSTASTAVALLANTQTIAFSKSDLPAATLSWDSPIAVDNLIVTGLVANTQYNAYQLRNAAPSLPYTVVLEMTNTNGALTSSAQGVITANTLLPLKAMLTVSKTGSGTATSISPGINCGSDCTEPYNANTSVTLTATPNTGSVFSSWTGCTSTSGNTCTVSMNGNKNVTANFISVPDLLMTQIQPASTSIKRGRTLKVGNAAQNRGMVDAGTFVIGFRLSLNNTYDETNDVIIAPARSVTSLAAGATTPIVDTILSVPSNIPANSYYVCAKADVGSAVAETNEGNNTLCSTGKVKVAR